MSVLKASEQNLTVAHHFSQEYKIYVFTTWYNSGKPTAKKLLHMLVEPDPETQKFPQPSTLATWIKSEFVAEAAFLDEQVAQELEKRLVTEKIEMLNRHSKTAQKMQTIALEWFEGNKDEEGNVDLGNARTAITMLVEGLKIEKESRGTPKIAEKFSRLSDEQLVDKLKDFVIDTSEIVSIEPVKAVEVRDAE